MHQLRPGRDAHRDHLHGPRTGGLNDVPLPGAGGRCAGNLSAYSSIATATTPAGGDTTAPSAPTALRPRRSARPASTWAGPPRPTTSGSRATAWSAARGRAAPTSPRWDADRDVLHRHRAGGAHDLPVPGAGSRCGRQPQRLLVDRLGDDAGRRGHDARRRRPPGSRPPRSARPGSTWPGPPRPTTSGSPATGWSAARAPAAPTSPRSGTPTATTFSNTGLAANTTYRFRVRAVDAAGNLSAYSADRHARRRPPLTPQRRRRPRRCRPRRSARPGSTWAGPPRPTTSGSPATAWSAARARAAPTSPRSGHRPGTSLQRHRPGGLDDLPVPGAGSRCGRQPQRLLLDRHGDDAGRVDTPAVGTDGVDRDVRAPAGEARAGPRRPTTSGSPATAWSAAGRGLHRPSPRSRHRPRRRTATPAWRPSTTYRYQVRAVDAAGNLSPYSSIATATTPDAPATPPGLVGAWGFNEGLAPPPPTPPATATRER